MLDVQHLISSIELNNCLKGKALDRKDVETIRSKLDMGVKRKKTVKWRTWSTVRKEEQIVMLIYI